MVESLIEKGNAYLAEDGVYFEIDASPEKYGQLTGQTLEMAASGAGGRVDKTGSGKRTIGTSLYGRWRSLRAFVGEPLGRREAGLAYRVLCDVSLKHLGERFDIHGGGSDLIFPHHEAEIFPVRMLSGSRSSGAVPDP